MSRSRLPAETARIESCHLRKWQWSGDDGNEMLGAVHMPSFPEFDWKQVTTWTTPAGQEVELELDFDRAVSRDTVEWSFGSTSMPYQVHVSVAGEDARSIRAGQSVRLAGGVVRAVDLRVWMGYQVEYLPFTVRQLLDAALDHGLFFAG